MIRSNHKPCLLSCIAAVFTWAWSPAPTAAQPISDLIPSDCLVAYMAKPYDWLQAATQPAESSPDMPAGFSVASIVAFLHAARMIPDEGQVFADIATALPLLGRYQHALVLLDVACKRVIIRPAGDDDREARTSLRLDRLQVAVIFNCGADDQPIRNQLDRVISRYTNRDVAVLTEEKAGGVTFQRLRDERMPTWAVWEWGRWGDYFIVTFGEGAFSRIAAVAGGAEPCLSRNPWFRSATEKTHGDRALVQWLIAFTRLKDALGAVAQGRVARVAAALGADHVTQDLWTIGAEDRSLVWYRCFRRDGKDVQRCYSDPANYPLPHRRIVPDQARHVAIIEAPTRWLVDNLPNAWVASQSRRNVRKWKRAWRSIEEETGIDINGNLIDHLGKTVVVYDYPPHPLGIPFALTLAIEIDDRRAVQMATDALLTAWGKYLDERAERNKTVLVRIKVKRDPDGVWFLQAGILGPALKVTDRYVVVSWSPQALRDALKFIEKPN